MPRSKDAPIDYAALAEFRYEVRRFLHFAEQMARTAGIEPQQYQALLAIRGLPDWARATVGALAERMQIRHHSAVELSGRLERAGWITRLRGNADRREVLLRLTPRGQRLLGKLSQLHRQELLTTSTRLIESLRSVVAHDDRSHDPYVKKKYSSRGKQRVARTRRAKRKPRIAS
jgi:DNA-binding MarR family transcriptional regulator